jgi:hypothetical protein
LSRLGGRIIAEHSVARRSAPAAYIRVGLIVLVASYGDRSSGGFRYVF